MASGEDTAESGKSGEVYILEKRGVGDEKNGARVFQLVADLAFAVRRVEKGRNSSGERGSVIGDGEFPGIGEEDANDFARDESKGDQAASHGFDEGTVFGKGETAIAGGVEKRGLRGMFLAALEYDIVHEASGGIGVELGSKHRGDSRGRRRKFKAGSDANWGKLFGPLFGLRGRRYFERNFGRTLRRTMKDRKSVRILSAVALLGIAVVILTAIGCRTRVGITSDELLRRTQERYENLAAGDQAPWKRDFAEDCLYFDEKGRNMNKAALVADVSPLPKGYSGTIKVVNPQSHIERNVAVFSYDMNETENVFGQEMTARYHATDTWMLRKGEWQVVAGQVLRYYEDPAAGKTVLAKLSEYAGTYELSPANRQIISVEGEQLSRQRGEQPKGLLIPEAGDIFFRKGVEGRILFRRGDDGKVDALVDRRNNEDVVWKKVQ